MNWTRAQLKKRGNEALPNNFWKCCFISGLLLVLSYGTVFTAILDFLEEAPTSIRDIYQNLTASDGKISMQLTALMITLTFGLLLLSAISKIVINVFVKNPVDVGASLFMRNSLRKDTGKVADITYAFDNHYFYHVKIMLASRIICLLWTLLLIVPGVYKNYQYRMVPYLLGIYPDLTPEEALKMSREMMMGNKKEALLLDLSFIPWHLAGILTFGILEIFYVLPYKNLVDACLFEAVHEEYLKKQPIME